MARNEKLPYNTTDTTITALDLSQNSFSEMAAEGICAGMKRNTAVQELHLSHNLLTARGVGSCV